MTALKIDKEAVIVWAPAVCGVFFVATTYLNYFLRFLTPGQILFLNFDQVAIYYLGFILTGCVSVCVQVVSCFTWAFGKRWILVLLSLLSSSVLFICFIVMPIST